MENYNDHRIEVYTSGKIKYEYYYLNGKIHRIDGPAQIFYFESGKIQYEGYYINDCQVDIKKFIKLIHKSEDKTKTLIDILNNHQELIPELKFMLIRILPKLFKNDIDQNVIDNLDLFI